jgi:hypothetical protein
VLLFSIFYCYILLPTDVHLLNACSCQISPDSKGHAETEAISAPQRSSWGWSAATWLTSWLGSVSVGAQGLGEVPWGGGDVGLDSENPPVFQGLMEEISSPPAWKEGTHEWASAPRTARRRATSQSNLIQPGSGSARGRREPDDWPGP